MNKNELNKILENHKKWLENKKDGECADLSFADLRNANLIGAYLRNVNLNGADLIGAELSYADLSGANLRNANLNGADLSGADLSYADLRGAYLSDADIRGANLSCADLSDAKNLETVYFNENTSMFALQCPEKGSFTAFKKLQNDIIAELFIPAKAKRSSATTRKCRASEAKVVKMWNFITKEIVTTAISQNDEDFIYETGKIIKPVLPFDEDRWKECASGIQFFMTQKEAEMY